MYISAIGLIFLFPSGLRNFGINLKLKLGIENPLANIIKDIIITAITIYNRYKGRITSSNKKIPINPIKKPDRNIINCEIRDINKQYFKEYPYPEIIFDSPIELHIFPGIYFAKIGLNPLINAILKLTSTLNRNKIFCQI